MPDAPDVLEAVRARYGRGAQERIPELCCPTRYDPALLEALPAEVVERDYGCGNPSRFVRRGDTVLDLGSGSGKIAFIAAQIAGPQGRVIGVDATPSMLELARRAAPEVAARVGFSNVEFRHALIQDLRLDRDRLAAWIAAHPVRGLEDLDRVRAEEERLRREDPMVADGTVDLVVSNCVLNLVDPASKPALFREIHRVLRRGGRCAISDIVADEDVPAELQRDPELWSGCLAGALREDRFLEAFAEAGLYGVEIESRQPWPWAVLQGIEFRPITVTAWKGKEGPCQEHNEAVIYRGPWKQVVDDDGHVLRRGEPTAVCRKTFGIYTSAPYREHVLPVPPLRAVAEEAAAEFDCRRDRRRDPQETKSGRARLDRLPDGGACDPATGCC